MRSLKLVFPVLIVTAAISWAAPAVRRVTIDTTTGGGRTRSPIDALSTETLRSLADNVLMEERGVDIGILTHILAFEPDAEQGIDPSHLFVEYPTKLADIGCSVVQCSIVLSCISICHVVRLSNYSFSF